MFDLVENLGCNKLYISHLVYSGRGLDNLEIDISKEEQLRRLKARQTDPLKMWKLSPIDMESHKHYDDYQKAKEDMFLATHTAYAPWITVNANDKKRARLNVIRDILSQLEYEGKDEDIVADSEIISMYHRH